MSFGKSFVGAFRMPGIAWSFSRVGYKRRARHFAPLGPSLAGKKLAVTGANGGIGFAIAKAWAQRDADVWMLCRNAERGEAAKQKLQGLGKGQLHLELIDMASLSSIDAFLSRTQIPHLDALVHNAGALVHENTPTPAGIELTFACHVVGPQRLTRGLLPILEQAADPRVIYVASGGMYSEKLSVDESLLPPSPFDGVRAYALAKRAQVVLAQRWAKEVPSVQFFAMHPGWVDTPGVEQSLPGFYRATKRWLRTTEEGADTAVWLSVAPTLELENGSFVFDRESVTRHKLPGTRAEESERGKLWQAVEDLANESSP